ncbi:MAG: glycosyltransferase family 2 protein [bacterium]
MNKIIIGIVTYNESTAKYLSYFLTSLESQTFKDFELLVYDNSTSGFEINKQKIIEANLTTEFFGDHANIGFGSAYNMLIKRAIEKQADFFLMLNVDMILNQDFVQILYNYLLLCHDVAVAVPKLLRWDFINNVKTKIIDSCGLVANHNFMFNDYLQGQIDRNQIYKPVEVFGFTGAAAMFNLNTLKSNFENNELFDELFFMYKEDCDLSVRFKLHGLKTVLVPNAVAYHDRSASGSNRGFMSIINGRRKISAQIKRWSFKNQLIIIYKYWALMTLELRIRASMHIIVKIVYGLLFERFVLGELLSVFRLRSLIKHKVQRSKVVMSKVEFSQLFNE